MPSKARRVQSRTFRTRLILSLFFGLAVFVGLLLYGDISGIGSSLSHFRWSLLPVILGLTLFNYAVRFLKWHYYLGLAGIRNVRLADSVNIFFAGLAMTITPGKLGEWLKSYLLKERYGTPVSVSAPIVLAERVTDAYGMILLACLGLFLFNDGWVFVIILSALGFAIAAMFRWRPAARWCIAAAGRLPLLRRHAPFIASFYESAYSLFSPRALAISVAMGFVSWLGEGIAMYYVLLGLGAPHSAELIVQGVFILSITSLAGAVAILPGGLGVVEGGITGLAQSLVGLSREAAATATLIIRIGTLWFGVAIGLVALVILTRRMGRDVVADAEAARKPA